MSDPRKTEGQGHTAVEVDAELHFFEWAPDVSRVSGNILGDRKCRFDDGDRVTTSRVVKQDGHIIHTQNSVYRLVTVQETLRRTKANAAMLEALEACIASIELNADPAGPTETEQLAIDQAHSAISQARNGGQS